MNEHHESRASKGNNDTYSQAGNKRNALSSVKTDDCGIRSPPKKVKINEDQSSTFAKTEHGKDYQIDICSFLCLANADQIDDANYWYKVTPENKEDGLFDDIVYQFKHDNTEGTLKIQTKHLKQKTSNVPNITWNDIITQQNSSPRFAIHRYFTSFYDMESQTSGPETKKRKEQTRLILCTNADMDDALKFIWKRIDPSTKSVTLLDSYISSLFAKAGGICYELNDVQLKDNALNPLLKQCSKRTRLAKLLVKATQSDKKKLMRHNTLIQEYAQAIANIIEWNRKSPHWIKIQFGYSTTSYDATLEAFKKEFEEQYRKEYKKPDDFDIWKEGKIKVYVSESLKSPNQIETRSKSSFPDDKIYEVNIKSFCQQFRLICRTQDSHELQKTIAESWIAWLKKNVGHDLLEASNYHCKHILLSITSIMKKYTEKDNDTKCDSGKNKDKHYFESKDVIDHLWRLYNDSREFPKATPSVYRIKEDSLKTFENKTPKTQNKYNEVTIHDAQFGSTVLMDIMQVLKTKPPNCYFFNVAEFYSRYHTDKALHNISFNTCLFVTCHINDPQYKYLKECVDEINLKMTEKISKFFFLKESDNTELLFFMEDLSHVSEEQIFEKNNLVPLCSTYIPLNILKDDLSQHYVEDVIKELNRGKKIEQNGAILKKFNNIKSTYVQRFSKKSTNGPMENLNDPRIQSEMSKIMTTLSKDTMLLTELSEILKKNQMLNDILKDCSGARINQESTQSVQNQNKKVEILLDEQDCGKSTHFTWLAWHLQESDKNSWIVSCNFSDHIHFYEGLNTENLNQEIQDLRILYQLVRSLVHLEDRLQRIESKRAVTCSNFMSFSCKTLSLKKEILDDKFEHKSFSKLNLEDKISLLVFQEKFNNGELKLLFDGFDGIDSSFQSKVLKLLSRLAKLNAIKQMFLISHDISKENIFEEEFNEPTFYQLQPLSINDKTCMLYKLFREIFKQDSLEEEKKHHLLMLLVLTIINTLGEQSNTPSNLVKSAHILGNDPTEYIDYTNQIINLKSLKQLAVAIKDKFKCNK